MTKDKKVTIKMDARCAAAVRQVLFEAQKDILDSGNEDEYNDYEDKKPKKSFEGFKF